MNAAARAAVLFLFIGLVGGAGIVTGAWWGHAQGRGAEIQLALIAIARCDEQGRGIVVVSFAGAGEFTCMPQNGALTFKQKIGAGL